MKFTAQTGTCDVCHKHRTVGNHERCARVRKARGNLPQAQPKVSKEKRLKAYEFIVRKLESEGAI